MMIGNAHALNETTYSYPGCGHGEVLWGNRFSILHQHLGIAGNVERGRDAGVGRNLKIFPRRSPVKPAKDRLGCERKHSQVLQTLNIASKQCNRGAGWFTVFHHIASGGMGTN